MALRWTDVDLGAAGGTRPGRIYVRNYRRSDGTEWRTKTGGEREVPLRLVQDVLGHSSIRTTETIVSALEGIRGHGSASSLAIQVSHDDLSDNDRAPGARVDAALRAGRGCGSRCSGRARQLTCNGKVNSHGLTRRFLAVERGTP
jgi:hypothetical protein